MVQATLEKDDALGYFEQERQQRDNASGLQTARRESPTESRATEQGSPEEDTVEQDQNEASRMGALNASKLQDRRLKAATDAKKIGKAAKDKATKYLVRRFGMRAATAAFLGSIVGIVVGLGLIFYRLVAADLFQVESEKFDNIFEHIAYYVVAILISVMMFSIMVIIIIMLMVQFGWIFGILDWVGVY